MQFMEIYTHNTRFSAELVFWPCWILDSVAADQTGALLQEIIRTITNGEQVAVLWIPSNRSDMLSPTFLS
jgi:hypothetical protein